MLPIPVPGLVIRYAYLWRRDYLLGLEEGDKDRPCAIILVSDRDGPAPAVTVLPVTHSPPGDADLAVEIPHATKRRLGLDDDRSFVILSEANRFIWPGPDLRPIGGASNVAYGVLPYGLFEEIRLKFLSALKARAIRPVPRTE